VAVLAATVSSAAARSTLNIGPDQSDSLPVGGSGTYLFHAQLDGDSGGVVELRRPQKRAGWSLKLLDASGTDTLTDTDKDGLPDLGYVTPGVQYWFSLAVQSPAWLVGDTAALNHRLFRIVGTLSGSPAVADTALLSLSRPVDGAGFSVHCFPNPLTTRTAFIIGLPAEGEASLTVYARDGERVRRVVEQEGMSAGVHVVRWDAANDHGREVAPGIYEYVLDYVHHGKTDRIRKRLVVRR
jgi:hypothetical protein